MLSVICSVLQVKRSSQIEEAVVVFIGNFLSILLGGFVDGCEEAAAFFNKIFAPSYDDIVASCMASGFLMREVA